MISNNKSGEFDHHLNAAKQILNKIRSRWPVEEEVRGGVSSPLVATLILPQSEWQTLTQDEQISLTFHTENMINDIRINPRKYLSISPNAPIYSSMLDNYRCIQDGFWQIMIGRIKDGKVMKLMVDQSVVRGDAYWDFEKEKFGVRASIFRQGRS